VRKTIQVFMGFLCSLAVASGTLPTEKSSAAAQKLLDDARFADARASEEGFLIRAVIRFGEGKGEEVEGHYLLAWASPARWREEFSLSDFRQVRVSAPGGVWEIREPNFLSLRLWQLMQAFNFYGRFNLQSEESAGKIKLRKNNGSELRCIDITRESYPLRELCFQEGAAQLVSEHYIPSDRWYKFSDYRAIHSKFFPGHIIVLDGKTLAADFSVSSVEETVPTTLFEPPAQAGWRPWCASPQSGGDPLTPIFSGSVKHQGVATLYGAIGTDGQWHDVHVLESGGASHDAEVLEALKKERWRPTLCNGVPIVVETVFRR